MFFFLSYTHIAAHMPAHIGGELHPPPLDAEELFELLQVGRGYRPRVIDPQVGHGDSPGLIDLQVQQGNRVG